MDATQLSPALQSARLTAEVVELKEQLREERKLRGSRDATIADQRIQIAELRKDLHELQVAFKKLLKGKPYEIPRIDPGQLNLFEGVGPSEPVPEDVPADVADTPDAESADEQKSKSKKPRNARKRSTRAIDESNLRREAVRYELPAEERRCPQTGVALVEVSTKVITEIDYRRAELVLVEHHQVVYGPPPEVAAERTITPIAGPEPSLAIEGVRASPALLAWILCQKYVLHLPLYRQEDAFQRLGVSIARQTLCDWVLKAAFALRPIASEIERQIRAGPVMQLDDTPVKCMSASGKSKRRKLRQAYLWVFTNPAVSGVVFRFVEGRSTEAVSPLLVGVEAEVLLGDGLATNRSAAREAGLDVVHAGCWAHALRKLRDATQEAPATMALFRDDLRTIYEIEARAAEEQLDADAIRDLRQREARPVVIEMLRRTSGWKLDFSSSGKVAEAMKYLRGQRRTLLAYLRDGRIPIDNNACERAIRPVAIGRRNWMFTGSAEGGEAAATIYTVVESAKAAGVDPLDYLTAVLGKLATHPADRVAELTPASMANAINGPADE